MRICVFCGSKSGHNQIYATAAREMGTALARSNVELVFGGGRVGLMGEVADAALLAGGDVIGVMPRSLVEREIQHVRLTQLHVVASMHERKTKMADLADAFVALPGGAGTLEEIFEQWTWAQLGIHQKPCGFLNANGYFDPLRRMIDQMTAEGFLHADHASMLIFDTKPLAIIEAFHNYSAPATKWQAQANSTKPNRIKIVAALIQDHAGRVLLARKKGTKAFMQPGGKLRDSESHLAALERELAEELSCSIVPGSPDFLGTFCAPAANEDGCEVEAALYRVKVIGHIRATAEIEEVIWLDPAQPGDLVLAPLTRDIVLRFSVRATGAG